MDKKERQLRNLRALSGTAVTLLLFLVIILSIIIIRRSDIPFLRPGEAPAVNKEGALS